MHVPGRDARPVDDPSHAGTSARHRPGQDRRAQPSGGRGHRPVGRSWSRVHRVSGPGRDQPARRASSRRARSPPCVSVGVSGERGGGVLMGANDRGVNADCPVDDAGASVSASSSASTWSQVPSALWRRWRFHRVCQGPDFFRGVTPGQTTPEPVDDALDHPPIVPERPSWTAQRGRQQRHNSTHCGSVSTAVRDTVASSPIEDHQLGDTPPRSSRTAPKPSKPLAIPTTQSQRRCTHLEVSCTPLESYLRRAALDVGVRCRAG